MKTIFLALAAVMSLGASAQAQVQMTPIAHIGHLRAEKQELDKKIVGGYLSVEADLAFAKVLADKARENGKRLGGDFEQKFEEDANTIEWDAQTKANEKKAQLDREMEPLIARSKALDAQIEKLVAEYLATAEGKSSVAAWRRMNAKALMGRSDRDLVLSQADLYYGVSQKLLEKKAGE